MYVRGNLTRADGSSLPEPVPNVDPENVNIVDNFVHSLFENVTLMVGRNQVELQCCNYPFKSFIKQLSSYHQKSIEMGMAGMTVDTGYSNLPPVALAKKRHALIVGSNEVEFSDYVLADFLSSDSYLIAGLPVKIKFRRSPSSFYVVKGADNDKDYVFNINEMKLKIPCVQVQPAILDMLTEQLDSAVANYFFRGLNMTQYN